MVENALSMLDIDLNDQFENQPVAQVPVYMNKGKNWEFENFTEEEKIVDEFRNGNYNIVNILKSRLDAAGY